MDRLAFGKAVIYEDRLLSDKLVLLRPIRDVDDGVEQVHVDTVVIKGLDRIPVMLRQQYQFLPLIPALVQERKQVHVYLAFYDERVIQIDIYKVIL